MRLTRHRTVAVAAALTFSVTASAIPVNAAPVVDPIQKQINAHLNKYPGGMQISNTQLSYDKGALVLNFANSAPTATAPVLLPP